MKMGVKIKRGKRGKRSKSSVFQILMNKNLKVIIYGRIRRFAIKCI